MFNWLIVYLIVSVLVAFSIAFYRGRNSMGNPDQFPMILAIGMLWPGAIAYAALLLVMQILALPARLGYMLAKRGNKK